MKLLSLCTFIFVLVVSFAIAGDIPYIHQKYIATSQVPEDLLIPDLGSVVVDNHGNVFAFAGKNNGNECFVIKWDKNLRFVKKFLGFGSGPAEVTMNQSSPQGRLSLDPFNHDLVIRDINPPKLVLFDNNGNYKKDLYPVRLSTGFMRVTELITLGNGNYAGFRRNPKTRESEVTFFTLEPTFKEQVIVSFMDKLMVAESKNTYLQYNMSDYCGPRNLIESDGHFFVVANTQFYFVIVFDCQGHTLWQAGDKEKGVSSFTETEMDFIIKKEFTEGKEFSYAHNEQVRWMTEDKEAFHLLLKIIKNNKNPIQNVRMSENRVYVFLVSEDITMNKGIPTVIYDMKGNILKKVYFPRVPDKIWQQYAYYLEYDNEDNPYIKKYQLFD